MTIITYMVIALAICYCVDCSERNITSSLKSDLIFRYMRQIDNLDLNCLFPRQIIILSDPEDNSTFFRLFAATHYYEEIEINGTNLIDTAIRTKRLFPKIANNYQENTTLIQFKLPRREIKVSLDIARSYLLNTFCKNAYLFRFIIVLNLDLNLETDIDAYLSMVNFTAHLIKDKNVLDNIEPLVTRKNHLNTTAAHEFFRIINDSLISENNTTYNEKLISLNSIFAKHLKFYRKYDDTFAFNSLNDDFHYSEEVSSSLPLSFAFQDSTRKYAKRISKSLLPESLKIVETAWQYIADCIKSKTDQYEVEVCDNFEIDVINAAVILNDVSFRKGNVKEFISDLLKLFHDLFVNETKANFLFDQFNFLERYLADATFLQSDIETLETVALHANALFTNTGRKVTLGAYRFQRLLCNVVEDSDEYGLLKNHTQVRGFPPTLQQILEYKEQNRLESGPVQVICRNTTMFVRGANVKVSDLRDKCKFQTISVLNIIATDTFTIDDKIPDFFPKYYENSMVKIIIIAPNWITLASYDIKLNQDLLKESYFIGIYENLDGFRHKINFDYIYRGHRGRQGCAVDIDNHFIMLDAKTPSRESIKNDYFNVITTVHSDSLHLNYDGKTVYVPVLCDRIIVLTVNRDRFQAPPLFILNDFIDELKKIGQNLTKISLKDRIEIFENVPVQLEVLIDRYNRLENSGDNYTESLASYARLNKQFVHLNQTLDDCKKSVRLSYITLTASRMKKQTRISDVLIINLEKFIESTSTRIGVYQNMLMTRAATNRELKKRAMDIQKNSAIEKSLTELKKDITTKITNAKSSIIFLVKKFDPIVEGIIEEFLDEIKKIAEEVSGLSEVVAAKEKEVQHLSIALGTKAATEIFSSIVNAVKAGCEVAVNPASAIKALPQLWDIVGQVASAGNTVTDTVVGPERQKVNQLEDEIKGCNDKIAHLNKIAAAIKNGLIKSIRRLLKTLQEAEKDLESMEKDSLVVNKFNLKLDVSKFRQSMFTTLKDTRCYKIVSLSVDNIDNLLTAIVEIFDIIQDYKQKSKDAKFLVDLNRIEIDDLELPVCKNMINLTAMQESLLENLIIQDAVSAISAFKQWVFPYADLYKRDFLEINEAYRMGGNASASRAILDLENILGILDEIKASVSRKSTATESGSFDTSGNHLKPFYVWKNSDHKFDIKSLLSGNTTELFADIRKENQFNAVKLRRINILLSAPTERIQQHVNMLMDYMRVEITHLGKSFYGYGNQVYTIDHAPVEITYAYPLVPPDCRYPYKFHDPQNDNYELLFKNEAMLSPYGRWRMKLTAVNDTISVYDELMRYSDLIDLKLVGEGSFIRNVDKDLKVERHYTLTDTFCGDGVLEGHEECDCIDLISNCTPCCNVQTCKWKKNFEKCNLNNTNETVYFCLERKCTSLPKTFSTESCSSMAVP